MSYSNVEHTTIKFRVHIVSVSFLLSPGFRCPNDLNRRTAQVLDFHRTSYLCAKKNWEVCRLSLLAAQALLPSHQVGNRDSNGNRFFPGFFE